MSRESDVSQKSNTVEGDLAGRDITKTSIVMPSPAPGSLMRTWVMKLQAEQGADNALAEICDKLQHFLQDNDEAGDLQGLEKKLELAGESSHRVKRASRLKELFAKRISQSALSETAQFVFAHTLGTLYHRFLGHIPPLVSKKAQTNELANALFEKVLKPTLEELLENPLNIDIGELEGMIYYLTGNCYIRWHDC